jgi:hypothetical protein
MRSRIAFTAVLLATTLGGGLARAQVLVPVSQTRTLGVVTSACGIDPQSDADVAPGMGPWTSGLNVTSVCPVSTSNGNCNQDSAFIANGIDAICFASGDVNATMEGSFGQLAAASYLSMTFDITVEASYSITAWMASFGGGTTSASLVLRNDNLPPGSALVFDYGVVIPLEQQIDDHGSLSPGRYTLSAVGDAQLTVSCCDWPIEMAAADFVFLVEEAPGTASCYGVGCPCGNDDPGPLDRGCANSTGSGGLLLGRGTTSIAADDLLLEASGLPTNNTGIYYMGDTQVQNPFFDGIQCALGTTFRFTNQTQSSGAAGTMLLGPGIVAEAANLFAITPGSTWHFHAWHRDTSGSPCGTNANLTNLYSVTFQP